MKRLFSFVFIFVSVLTLVAFSFGCSKQEEKQPTKQEPAKTQEPAQTGEPAGQTLDVLVSEEFFGLCKGKKVYASTCGQADLETLGIIVEDGLESLDMEDPTVYQNDLVAADVEDGSVVLLVVGGSNKGLGAAKTDVASEAARASEFASKAEDGKITLVVIHIGGTARRGDTSDPIIKAAAPSADLLLVVAEGNGDGYFTNVSSEHNIPLFLYSKTSKMKPSFVKLFE